MINIKWDEKFELGHERIDAEHRIFLDLIRAVSALDPADADRERLGRMLTEVLKYAEFHFVSEENLMTDIRYPAIEAHRYEHAMLLDQLREMISTIHHGGKSIDDMVEFLFHWFALHTTQVDKRLASYVAAMGG